MRDARRELAEGGELLRLDEAVLRLPQIVERGGELLGARLHLVEQARVLDRDDGLIGEGLQDFDLAPGEGAGLETRQDDGPFDPVLPEEGHPNQGARGIAVRVYRNRIFRVFANVRNLLNLPGQDRASYDGSAPRIRRVFDEIMVQFRARARSRRGPIAENLPVAHADRAAMRPAQLHR